MDGAGTPSCPFCEFSDSDTYFLMQHVELYHPENGASPFLVTDDNNTQESNDQYGGASEGFNPSKSPLIADDDELNDASTYVDCPSGCGETITVAEISSHLDLHMAEGIALEEESGQQHVKDSKQKRGTTKDYLDPDYFDDEDDLDQGLDKSYGARDQVLQPKHGRKRGKQERDGPINSKPSKQKARAKISKTPSDPRQLGKAELGPHAHEKQMPAWLRRMLEENSKVTRENKIQRDGTLVKVEVVANETPKLIPVLAGLCEQDDSVAKAAFCNPKVRHVFKLPKEGGFCGYRNIQMLVSYIQGFRAYGHEHFPGRTPSILKLQDMIEQAWEMGFNSNGRIETGGIRGTRKYIGTSEAQALFDSLGIECQPSIFNDSPEQSAHDALYRTVRDYFFQESLSGQEDRRIIQTQLPPIYLQHAGHSLTIVGFEVHKDGSKNILVFDPMFKTSPAAERLIDTKIDSSSPSRVLKAFRRSSRYLGRYDEFETLQLFPSSS